MKFLLIFAYVSNYNNHIISTFEVVGLPARKPVIMAVVFSVVDFSVILTGVVGQVVDLFANLPAYESFVYLIGKSKIEEATAVFKRIGRFNRISKDQLDFKLKSPTFFLNVLR